MDQNVMTWLRLLLWGVAIILFIVGGYSDTDTTELWGWGFALLTAGFVVKHIPTGMTMGVGKRDT